MAAAADEMSWPRLTYWIVIVVLGLLTVYDLVALETYGPAATLSDVLQQYGFRFPILDFAAGVIVGHLLWPVLGSKK